MNLDQFIKELKKRNIVLSTEQVNLLEKYKNFLIAYNEHTNITAIKDEKSIYLKHFYDSITLQKYIKKDSKVLDIGTGAGFSGMVLALLNPDCHFILLDSNNKKIEFLKELNKILNLKNIELINERAEKYIHNHLEEFDLVTSRAVAELRILAELSLPALKIGGSFLPMKAKVDEELENSQMTIEILGGQILGQEKFQLPIENSERTIINIIHNKKTDKRFPRSYDKILKKPLKK